MKLNFNFSATGEREMVEERDVDKRVCQGNLLAEEVVGIFRARFPRSRGKGDCCFEKGSKYSLTIA